MEQLSQEQPLEGDPIINRIAEEARQKEINEAVTGLTALLDKSGIEDLIKGVTVRYRERDMRIVEVFGGVMVELQDDQGNTLFVPSDKLVL